MLKSKKTWFTILFLIIMVFTLIIALSPYKKHKKETKATIKSSIIIASNAGKVYQYLGNSANAHDWSSFVDHIVPLNTDSVADGKKGSKRRCFQKKDASGMRWDEEITIDEPNKRRQLVIFNYVNFPMQSEDLATEQLYVPLDSTHTQLTFTVFYANAPSWADWFQTCLAAYKMQPIFERNLSNIKRNLEKQI
jgi:hypothetical protein